MGALSRALAQDPDSAQTPSVAEKWAARSPKGPIIQNSTTPIASFKKGGAVRKTGLAKVHKGEHVLNRKQARKYARHKKACPA